MRPLAKEVESRFGFYFDARVPHGQDGGLEGKWAIGGAEIPLKRGSH